ncbi:lipoate--protein ligase [Clostridium sp.]|uniref:lipoate--protein ligase n=1 Tax=Clostridium sp. TaxID=1506 RepID=UPI002613A093|nr:lipoate--protein ligase [uncultured Clostridium sp.]
MHNSVITSIITSSTFDPWYNLALEEFLLNHVRENEIILYLWQNDNTVVVGKNQNCWKECKCRELEMNGGKLARRLSGGGAVYHDLGNLNFTFVMDKELYDLEKQLMVIIEAIKNVGIEAEFSGRNDITVNGKKFSGNAFYYTKNTVLHHGTLLINSDFSKLAAYLQVSKEKIKSKGVESVQSRVINLKEINSSITLEEVISNLKSTFIKFYGGNGKVIDINLFEEEINSLYNKYSSWQWRYGESPSFDISFQRRFFWGEIEICLKCKAGYIVDSKVYSDAMDYEVITQISKILNGIRFQRSSIINSIRELNQDGIKNSIIEDITEWLNEKQL